MGAGASSTSYSGSRIFLSIDIPDANIIEQSLNVVYENHHRWKIALEPDLTISLTLMPNFTQRYVGQQTDSKQCHSDHVYEPSFLLSFEDTMKVEKRFIPIQISEGGQIRFCNLFKKYDSVYPSNIVCMLAKCTVTGISALKDKVDDIPENVTHYELYRSALTWRRTCDSSSDNSSDRLISLFGQTNRVFAKSDTTDVVIHCGDRKFYVHSIVLATRCEFFKTVLLRMRSEGNPMEHPIKDASPETVELFLRIVYDHEQALSAHSILLCKAYRLAHLYQIEGVKNAVIDALIHRKLETDSITEVTRTAWFFDITELFNQVFSTAGRILEQLEIREDWRQLMIDEPKLSMSFGAAKTRTYK